MRWPRFPHVPPGFGGFGSPPGFGGVGTSGPESEPGEAQRGSSGSAPLVTRNPTDDDRLRPFTDVIQQEHNSLVRRGYLVRDVDLEWSIAPNPYRVARDPTAADDATAGVLRGDTWINTETGEVWYNRDNSIGTAVWVRLVRVSASIAGWYTETFP